MPCERLSAILAQAQRRGKIILVKRYKGREIKQEKSSACEMAKVLGVISPKTKSKKVAYPTARPSPFCPLTRIKAWVTKALVVIFTSIFPVRMVFSVRRGESNNCAIRALCLGFFSFSLRNCILDKEKRAVSEAEKRPENISKITSVTIYQSKFK